MEEAFQKLWEVVQEVPSVGYLHCLRRSFGNPAGIFRRAIARNNLDPGMSFKPAPQSVGRPIWKHVYGTPFLKINQNRPPGLAFAPRPVVNAQNARHGFFRNRMPMEHPEKSVWTCVHSEQTQETCASFCTDRKADVGLRFGKPSRSPRVCWEQVCQRFCKVRRVHSSFRHRNRRRRR